MDCWLCKDKAQLSLKTEKRFVINRMSKLRDSIFNLLVIIQLCLIHSIRYHIRLQSYNSGILTNVVATIFCGVDDKIYNLFRFTDLTMIIFAVRDISQFLSVYSVQLSIEHLYEKYFN